MSLTLEITNTGQLENIIQKNKREVQSGFEVTARQQLRVRRELI